VTATEVLQLVQQGAFLGLGVTAVALWLRRRTRPSVFLAVAFSALALVGVSGWLGAALGAPGYWQLASVCALAAFPWLLAAFAWSFAGPLPTWLRLVGVLVLALCAWVVLADPLGDPDGQLTRSFLFAFVVVWMLSSVAAAARLWRSGGGQRLVRIRMRALSIGAIALTIALVLAALGAEGAITGLQATTPVLAIGAAALFLAGFAPPPPLRRWWRRRATARWARMQSTLIAAATPVEVAAAVVAAAEDLVGGDAAVLDRDGHVMAYAVQDTAHLGQLGGSRGEIDPATTRQIDAGSARLVVRRTPYTPMFGHTERELLESLAVHLQLAMERAELFEAHQRALAEAERTQHELQSLLTGLAHDLRSPAVAISGYTRLLRDARDADDAAEMLDAVDQSATYLNTLVSSMLELSRVGRTQLDTEDVDLGTIVDAVTSRVQVEHPDVSIVVEGELPVVTMNPARAEQVVDNLLFNAAKHGGQPDLTITVHGAATEDGGQLLVVHDDGRGIDDEDRAAIFAPFHRGRSAAPGSGVGLGMVRRILEVAGASITLADSEVGARFEVHLPPDLVAGTASRTHAHEHERQRAT
jgi:signal transduction histidine kinase